MTQYPFSIGGSEVVGLLLPAGYLSAYKNALAISFVIYSMTARLRQEQGLFKTQYHEK